MNWKKILLATLGGAFAGTVGSWSSETVAGHHVPFTVGTIVVPAVVTVIPTLLALFTKRPQDR